jgi:coenzyme F420-reducing hydrogenase alpha subunit
MMINDFGDNKVTVKKSDLLEALQKNRTTHAKDYAEAFEGYKVAFVQEAVKLLEQAKAGNFEKTNIGLAPPKDHTKDYDRVIRMLEMSTADEWTVSESQFTQYVLDEWGWQQEFNTSKMRYSNR